jgi:hypothetical protein
MAELNRLSTLPGIETAEGALAGPSELSAAILALKPSQANHPNPLIFSPQLSDDAIRRLVELAYHASMVADEGRFPRFGLVSRDRGNFLSIANIDEPLDEVDTLRRLGQTCLDEDDLLWVTEESGSLHCRGLVAADPGVSVAGEEQPVILGMGLDFAVMVRGPGHLEVEIVGQHLGLKGGKIRSLSPWHYLETPRRRWNAIAGAAARARGLPTAERVYTDRVGSTILWATSRVLRSAMARKHGGCFVVLPADTDPGAEIKLRYRVPTASALSLSSLAADLCWQCWQGRNDPVSRDRYSEELLRHRLRAAAETVDRASAVDGCVVLGDGLQLLGFGGKIVAGDKDPDLELRALTNKKTGYVADLKEALLSVGGTRHQSALRLCMKVPGTMAFVVSQDGDLKVFWSERNATYGFKELVA